MRAKDGAGNWGSTDHYGPVKIDDASPSAPVVSSSTHPENVWKSSDDPSFSWTQPSDTSGITGYSYVFDHSSSTTPDTTSEGTSRSKSYSNQADGTWYFHVRAKDGAGNWGSTDHYGPIKIGTPDIAVSPESWDYGDVVVDSHSDKTFTVSNPGNAPLEVTETSLTGDNVFSIHSGGGSFTLNPGETHDIVVRFAPTEPGTKSATLSLGNNVDGKNPLDVSLSGTGIRPDTVATPTFSPAPGTDTSAQDVSISCATSGATIHYTTNGSDPTESDPVYSSPVHIASTTTLKAKAYKSGWSPSSVASGVYTINPVQVKISGIKVSNINDTSAVISWITDAVISSACVNYGATASLGNTACDNTDDDVHYVELTGLTVEATYYYEVVSGGTTEDNNGAYYTFTTTKVQQSPSTPHNLYGTVKKGDNCDTVVQRAIVYVSVTHVGTTSYLLSNLTNASGLWTVDLGNLKDPNTNDVFNYATGDAIHIDAQGAADGTGEANTTVSASQPQLVDDICLTTIVCHDITLAEGLNLVSLPVSPETAITSHSLISSVGCIKQVTRWVGAWESAFDIGGGIILGPDFELEVGKGYFVLADSQCIWEVCGVPIKNPVTLNLQAGLNLASVPCPADKYTSHSTISSIPCTQVTRWVGAWESAFDIGGGTILGPDFPIELGKGYFVLVNQATNWTPSTQPAPSISGKQLSKGMELEQLPLNIGIPHIVYGQLIDADSKTPVPKKEVFVTVRQGRFLSQKLVCTTDSLGYFNVDLGNLQTSVGTVFKYQTGDEIHLEVAGMESQQIQVKREKIQDIGKLFISLRGGYHTIPKVMSLGQNYPNPFNPDTWIPYQIAKTVDVTISIYNSTGQLVRSFPLGDKPAGDYLSRAKALHWNGRNEGGEEVASGIYFYELTAGSFVAVKKMVIIR